MSDETCAFCGKPAVCCARDDDGDEYACDGCCGHGCDVGCFYVRDPETLDADNDERARGIE